MTKTSRRLKHYHDTVIVFINTSDPKSDLQEIIMNNTGEFVRLTYKAAKKGTLEEDIKLVECDLSLRDVAEGVIVKINLHVHHYSAVYFDLQAFLARLNTVLALKPGSVVETEEPKKEIKQPKKIITKAKAPEEESHSFLSS